MFKSRTGRSFDETLRTRRCRFVVSVVCRFAVVPIFHITLYLRAIYIYYNNNYILYNNISYSAERGLKRQTTETTETTERVKS